MRIVLAILVTVISSAACAECGKGKDFAVTVKELSLGLNRAGIRNSLSRECERGPAEDCQLRVPKFGDFVLGELGTACFNGMVGDVEPSHDINENRRTAARFLQGVMRVVGASLDDQERAAELSRRDTTPPRTPLRGFKEEFLPAVECCEIATSADPPPRIHVQFFKK